MEQHPANLREVHDVNKREPLCVWPGVLVLAFTLGRSPPQAAGKGLDHGGSHIPSRLPAGQDGPSALSPDGADHLQGALFSPQATHCPVGFLIPNPKSCLQATCARCWPSAGHCRATMEGCCLEILPMMSVPTTLSPHL